MRLQEPSAATLYVMGESTDGDPHSLTTDALVHEIQASVRVLLLITRILRRNQNMVLQHHALEFIMTYAPEIVSDVSSVLVPSDRHYRGSISALGIFFFLVPTRACFCPPSPNNLPSRSQGGCSHI